MRLLLGVRILIINVRMTNVIMIRIMHLLCVLFAFFFASHVLVLLFWFAFFFFVLFLVVWFIITSINVICCRHPRLLRFVFVTLVLLLLLLLLLLILLIILQIIIIILVIIIIRRRRIIIIITMPLISFLSFMMIIICMIEN